MEFVARFGGDIKSNGQVPFAANQSMGGHKLTNLAAPTNPNDAARLADVPGGGAGSGSYVDLSLSGDFAGSASPEVVPWDQHSVVGAKLAHSTSVDPSEITAVVAVRVLITAMFNATVNAAVGIGYKKNGGATVQLMSSTLPEYHHGMRLLLLAANDVIEFVTIANQGVAAANSWATVQEIL